MDNKSQKRTRRNKVMRRVIGGLLVAGEIFALEMLSYEMYRRYRPLPPVVAPINAPLNIFQAPEPDIDLSNPQGG
jgi:hypothetical protein